MDTGGLEALRAELLAARPSLAGIMEGLQHDLEQRDITDHSEIEGLLGDFVHRESLMQTLDARASATLDAVAALLADGYPALPERDIDAAIFEALEQNRRTMEAAQGQFRPRAITVSGSSSVGPEQPVP